MRFEYPQTIDWDKMIEKNEQQTKRILSSVKMLEQMQSVFSRMVLTYRKYVDPISIVLPLFEDD